MIDPPPMIRARYAFAGCGDDAIPYGAVARLDDRGHAYTFDLPPDGDGCVPFVSLDFVTHNWRMFEPVLATLPDG